MMLKKLIRKIITNKYKTMCVCYVVSLLVLCGITCSSFAKYISDAEHTSNAGIAKFGTLTLTETGDFADTNSAIILPGVDLTKDATVSMSGGEMATFVFVEITLSSNWATSDNRSFNINNLLSWSVTDGTDGWTYLRNEHGTYVFYRMVSPNENMNADIIADNGKITVSENITKAQLSALSGTFINLRASAVQASGFGSAEDAWLSISN